MSWPDHVSPERYPGAVRRRIDVEAIVAQGCVVYIATLRDCFVDDAAGAIDEIHGYELRLEAEPPDLTVVAVSVTPGFLPFPECPAATEATRGLIGLRLTGGFRKGAVECLGGSEGCTHLLTLALAIGDQAVVSRVLFRRVDRKPAPGDPERLVGVCAGWRDGGAAVRLMRAGQLMPQSEVQRRGKPFSAP